jgi:hypothetical protein
VAEKWDGARVTIHISSPPKQLLATKLPPQQRMTAVLQLIAAILAFWPIWFWYCERISDRSDEPLGVLALITVIALSWGKLTGRADYTLSIAATPTGKSGLTDNNPVITEHRTVITEHRTVITEHGIVTDNHGLLAKAALLWSAGCQPAASLPRTSFLTCLPDYFPACHFFSCFCIATFYRMHRSWCNP